VSSRLEEARQLYSRSQNDQDDEPLLLPGCERWVELKTAGSILCLAPTIRQYVMDLFV
jgi:hypothetical protein